MWTKVVRRRHQSHSFRSSYVGVATGLGVVAIATVWLGCSATPPEPSVLQSEDISDAPFDANEIVLAPAFEDSRGVNRAVVTEFLRHTPYGRSSFLLTLQSNGVTAIDAIVNAAQDYNLNPMVFIVRAQMASGLVGERNYPSPPTRVEYAFGCGCDGRGHCDPARSGFDIQVACLGASLRESLDQIKANGQTAGGWGPGKTTTTLDGIKVIPHDESTAALYQYLPIAGATESGNHLFWNIWKEYTAAIQYKAPSAMTSLGRIGDSCASDSECQYPGGFCANGSSYPGGMCLVPCQGACQFSDSVCVNFGGGISDCARVCDPANPDCRSGYACVGQTEMGTGEVVNVCF